MGGSGSKYYIERKNKMYLIKGNENFQTGIPIAVSPTKKLAEEFVKSLGFFRKDDLWVNSKGDDGGWLKIVEIEVIGEDNIEIARFIEHLTGR